ncbi:anion exchange transporter [Galendromus occidentalis]|uniref:Anion exchange transporter n=1 Tax=Galendromus occidentalis TaxID=34638 RepID=A0AAJ7SIU3_9ACAR|nr:anion exchange transporter [Galendromus occidentalis]
MGPRLLQEALTTHLKNLHLDLPLLQHSKIEGCHISKSKGRFSEVGKRFDHDVKEASREDPMLVSILERVRKGWRDDDRRDPALGLSLNRPKAYARPTAAFSRMIVYACRNLSVKLHKLHVAHPGVRRSSANSFYQFRPSDELDGNVRSASETRMDNKGFINSSTTDIPGRIEESSNEHAINANVLAETRRQSSSFRFEITPDDLYGSSSDHSYRKRTENANCARKMAARFHPKRLVPILDWLPRYELENLKDDVVAAITVAIMHVPQGLAYGELAGATAIQGLYVSTFPPLIYALLGTGKHISIGTFAVVSLLVRSATPVIAEHTVSVNGTDTQIGEIYSVDEVISTFATVVGLLQVILGICSLGSLSVLLSEPMLSGFTTGAATHVIASQLKGLFDIQVQRRKGVFKVILSFYDVAIRFLEVNVATTVMSLTAVVVIYQGQFLNEKFKAKLFMPVPVELVVVIIVTLISYITRLSDLYGSAIMGEVPTGLPPVTMPRMILFPAMLKEAFIVAFISYVICLSLGKTFARRNGYRIDANQELIAMGSANVFGSFLDCFPCAASLSRSSLQEKIGSKSQLSSLISSALLIVVILFAGPLFFYLPKCVLSSIIIVALKGMILQVNDCFRYARVSRMEAVVWLSTFLGCFVLDLEYGIVAGAICTVGTLLYRDSKPRIRFVKSSKKGRPLSQSTSWSDDRQVSVIRVESEINFINRDAFKDQLLSLMYVDDAPAEAMRKSLLVLDLSLCPYIDSSGCTTIREILTHFTKLGFRICVVGAHEGVTESVMLSGDNEVTFSANLKNVVFDLSYHPL